MSKAIPLEVKKTCLEMKSSGLSPKEIYYNYFAEQFDHPQSYESFFRSIQKWAKKMYPDSSTLIAGTYEGFTAHDATVQVNANGEIVQAWIKQKETDLDIEKFMTAIRSSVEPYTYDGAIVSLDDEEMLEIPLFDMHWGVVYFDHYESLLNEVLSLIHERRWGRVVIPFGQDFFHNDSIEHGVTSNGTQIEKVDMERAVKEGKQFMFAIVDAAIQNGSKVEVIYTPGNHDRSISWMFIQVLMERYGPDVVDDSFLYRKCVAHGSNAIMLTHGDSKRANAKNLAHIFPITFPNEFANANIREVHSGHLHHESEEDIFGVMVRRLSAGNGTDEWTNREDFIGSHKRFMLFRWTKTKLKAIYYV